MMDGLTNLKISPYSEPLDSRSTIIVVLGQFSPESLITFIA